MSDSWALALHGGAGPVFPGLNAAPYRDALAKCLERGVNVLSGKSPPSFSPYEHLNTAMQAVIETVIALEDSDLFNAGRGAVLNEVGKYEMDAQVMDNRGHCGACTGLTSIRNPVLAAERVMSCTKHAFLTSPSAEKFAISQGLATEPAEYFIGDECWEVLCAAHHAKVAADDAVAGKGDSPAAANEDSATGTVGAVAKDQHGNIACATSTGGTINKMIGRVGDTPIIGAGLYATDKGGVCGTGKGEAFLYNNTCGRICAAMDYGGLSMQEACEKEIGRLRPGDGGVMAVDSNGKVVFQFNSTGMFRAMEESSGRRGVAIRQEWEEKNFD